MMRIKSFMTLLSATLLGVATSGLAEAQVSERQFEVRPFLGAYLPTGDHRDLLGDAITAGMQAGYTITEHLSLVATLGVTPSSDKRIPRYSDIDLFTYDIGAELTKSFDVGQAGMTLSPFLGVGAGGRTYDYRDWNSKSETNFAGYGAIGGQLRMASLGVRVEARDYLSSFKGLIGEMPERETRNDLTIVTALSLSF
ncbi:MAG TPA: outer membrane beta-barrel protein [Gemmatimonadaceae bacterium]|nr:outer membrane beta-barrel protein [Gemmatimonadaceae bacterium]